MLEDSLIFMRSTFLASVDLLTSNMLVDIFLVDMETAKHNPKNIFPQANIKLNYSPSLGQTQK